MFELQPEYDAALSGLERHTIQSPRALPWAVIWPAFQGFEKGTDIRGGCRTREKFAQKSERPQQDPLITINDRSSRA